MGLKLSSPPGFADLADSVLASNSPAFSFNVGKIHENSRFAMARTEVFSGEYKNGDTVSLPISPIDGYAYSRDELMYFWTVRNSTDASTLWISGADSLFYCAWLVDQATGNVFSDEWYRRSGNHADVNHTNDGKLQVWTVAQRQLSHLIVASSPSYSAITASWIGLDKPLTEQLAQGLNHDAKFACLNHEFFYLGDYYNGQTVTMPISPADGHHYSAAECKFMLSWRWTSTGNSATLQAPALAFGQLGPMKASINGSGVVSCSVAMIGDNGALTTYTTLGKVAVFAFCQRSGTPGSVTPAANQFAEVSFDEFMPGADLPFGNVTQIVNNILEGLLTPEFFASGSHATGDTIALPTSPIDGYVYSRSELQYLWYWSDTTNQTGSDLRVPLFFGSINDSTGVVTLHVWRLPPGTSPVDDNDTLARINVLIVARRNAPTATALSAPATNAPADTGTLGNADAPSIGGKDARSTTAETIGIGSQGKLVTLNNSSAIAVTLNSSSVPQSFVCAVKNLGSGTATLTPSSGTIDGGASLTLASNASVWLFFDGTNWQSLTLGSTTVNALTPKYLTAVVPNGSTASGSAFAYKGQLFNPDVTIDVYEVWGWIVTPVSGATYNAIIAQASSFSSTSPTIASVPSVGTAVVNGTGTVAAWFRIVFSSPVTLVAGTPYVIMFGRTDGGNTYALPLNGPAATPIMQMQIPARPGFIARLASTTPANGNSLDTSAGTVTPFSLGLVWAIH
jgi:hypothetical protein